MTERELIAFFQDLHRHPELAFGEVRTTEKVRAALRTAGVEMPDIPCFTGLIAVVRGALPGRVIGLRCDMDALPVQEESGLPYASCEAGKMHACGHDFHTSLMLGTALLLQAGREELRGTVKIAFQPAEEINQGGRALMETGLLDDVEEFYAPHTYHGFPAGTLGIKEGPVMAAPDRFSVTLRGKGAHAGQPHKGVDPIPALAALVQSLQCIVSREVNAFTPAVLSITRVQAGSTWNVVPESAYLEGTVRTLDNGVRQAIRASLLRTAEGLAAAHGCTAECEYEEGPDPVINDAALCAAARDIALEMGFAVERQEDTMGGEDFSEYLKRAPGVFIRVGTGGGYANHHPRFTADPAALWPAARFFAALARKRAEIQSL